MPKVRIKQIEQIQASDIYLEKDLLITSKVGEIQAFDQGKNYATITAVKPDGSRKSLQNVLEEIFSKDSQPTVSNPKVTLMRHGVNGDTLDDDRYVEAGTIVEFGEIPLRFNQGSYQFGPDTQCEPLKAHFARVLNGEEASYENVDFDARTANLPAGSISVNLGKDTDLYVKAYADYTEGQRPMTQLGNPAEAELTIQAGSTDPVVTKHIRGYLKYFHGASEKAGIDIDGGWIRTLTHSKTPVTPGAKMTLRATESTKAFVVAVPNSERGKASISALLTTSMNADISSNFKESRMMVKDAGGNEHEYTAFVFQPDQVQGNEVIDITINY